MPIQESPLFRIGAVSIRAGIPVSTIRIWETRYGAFSPIKTEGKQRLFGASDVSKAILLKQLVNEGHAIGTIAGLDLEQLSAMSHPPPKALRKHNPKDGHISLAVVGLSLAKRIESKNFSKVLSHRQIKVTDVFADLEAAHLADFLHKPQILMVKVNTLHAEVNSAIRALIQKHRFSQAVVIYNFASESVVQALKFSGFIVRREPVSDTELAELLQSQVFEDEAHFHVFDTTGNTKAARRYSDETLIRVAGISTHVLCECPRHVAEIISQLASFEQYSQECFNKSSQDAHLHAHLHAISGAARSLFEDALEKIAKHEGIDLNEIKNEK